MKALLAAALVALATPALAWEDSDRISASDSLGGMLGSEQACGLTYDHAAIAAWIDANVPADDLQFANMLDLYTRDRTKDLTPAQKVAYCHQVERSARAVGFIK